MQHAFCSAFWEYFLLFWYISGCFCALSRDSDNCCTCTVEFSSVSDFGANWFSQLLPMSAGQPSEPSWLCEAWKDSCSCGLLIVLYPPIFMFASIYLLRSFLNVLPLTPIVFPVFCVRHQSISIGRVRRRQLHRWHARCLPHRWPRWVSSSTFSTWCCVKRRQHQRCASTAWRV